MVKALFDSNILIDHLRGFEVARDELALYADPAISLITWMEVMAGATPAVQAATRAFLDGFQTLGVDAQVAEQAVVLRRESRLRLPDAIIFATAKVHGRLLVTRNTRDFSPDDPGVRAPYRLPT